MDFGVGVKFFWGVDLFRKNNKGQLIAVRENQENEDEQIEKNDGEGIKENGNTEGVYIDEDKCSLAAEDWLEMFSSAELGFKFENIIDGRFSF